MGMSIPWIIPAVVLQLGAAVAFYPIMRWRT
jgi:hypothetical protein